jgi:serine kinase of HPr protein (carbohydrate metabolism regulator)
MSIVVEVAAMNLRAKKMGIHSAKNLEETLIKAMNQQDDICPDEAIQDWTEDFDL